MPRDVDPEIGWKNVGTIGLCTIEMLGCVYKGRAGQIRNCLHLEAVHRRATYWNLVWNGQSFDSREQELLWDLLYRSHTLVRSDIMNTIMRHNRHLYLICESPFDVHSGEKVNPSYYRTSYKRVLHCWRIRWRR